MSEMKKSVQTDSLGEAGSLKSEGPGKPKAKSKKRKAVAKPEVESPEPEVENKSEVEQPKSEIEHPKSEINMEVHHHPEVDKKGFKEYLLEGLMIFLAVTMGFFAENLRESISQ
jgi:hypothetical protein